MSNQKSWIGSPGYDHSLAKMVRAFASTRFYSPSAGAVPLASTNVPTASESKNHDDEGDYGIQAEVNDSNIENDSGSPVLAP